jgi:hypothetical protein
MTVSRSGIARIGMIALGAGAIAWAMLTLPTFWREASIERVADQVIAGDTFVGEGLTPMLAAVEANEASDRCLPPARRAAAIIRVRLAEEAMAAAESDRIDAALGALRDSIRGSLACSPADSFLWLVLFWVENARDGFSPAHFAYLRMSYALGPNEGWIALKRSPLALALYARLPPDLADKAAAEFVGLIDSGFVRQAAGFLTASAWPHRDALLPRLQALPTFRREALARAVADIGYVIDIPGVKRAEPRPWR